MSEIKGQLLGVILVLALFGAVAASMFGIFNNATKNIEKKADEEMALVSSAQAQSNHILDWAN